MVSSNGEVVLRVKGGLGNQMFQYAAALSVAIRSNVPLAIDSHTGFPIDPLRRQYKLDRYPIAARILSEEEAYSVLHSSRFGRRFRSGRERLRQKLLRSTFDPAVCKLRVRGRLSLEGFWNSPHYFSDCADLVRSHLASPTQLSNSVISTAHRLSDTNSVALHRRYFGLERAQARPGVKWEPAAPYTLEDGYYYNAIQHMKERLGRSVHIYVFSDAPDRALQGLPPGTSATIVEIPDRTDYEDLYLFSKCRSHIIANSTFSWWGAWLGKHSEQIVCAPAFFGNVVPEKFLRDVYPTEWTVVRTEVAEESIPATVL